MPNNTTSRRKASGIINNIRQSSVVVGPWFGHNNLVGWRQNYAIPEFINLHKSSLSSSIITAPVRLCAVCGEVWPDSDKYCKKCIENCALISKMIDRIKEKGKNATKIEKTRKKELTHELKALKDQVIKREAVLQDGTELWCCKFCHKFVTLEQESCPNCHFEFLKQIEPENEGIVTCLFRQRVDDNTNVGYQVISKRTPIMQLLDQYRNKLSGVNLSGMNNNLLRSQSDNSKNLLKLRLSTISKRFGSLLNAVKFELNRYSFLLNKYYEGQNGFCVRCSYCNICNFIPARASEQTFSGVDTSMVNAMIGHFGLTQPSLLVEKITRLYHDCFCGVCGNSLKMQFIQCKQIFSLIDAQVPYNPVLFDDVLGLSDLLKMRYSDFIDKLTNEKLNEIRAHDLAVYEHWFKGLMSAQISVPSGIGESELATLIDDYPGVMMQKDMSMNMQYYHLAIDITYAMKKQMHSSSKFCVIGALVEHNHLNTCYYKPVINIKRQDSRIITWDQLKEFDYVLIDFGFQDLSLQELLELRANNKLILVSSFQCDETGLTHKEKQPVNTYINGNQIKIVVHGITTSFDMSRDIYEMVYRDAIKDELAFTVVSYKNGFYLSRLIKTTSFGGYIKRAFVDDDVFNIEDLRQNAICRMFFEPYQGGKIIINRQLVVKLVCLQLSGTTSLKELLRCATLYTKVKVVVGKRVKNRLSIDPGDLAAHVALSKIAYMQYWGLTGFGPYIRVLSDLAKTSGVPKKWQSWLSEKIKMIVPTVFTGKPLLDTLLSRRKIGCIFNGEIQDQTTCPHHSDGCQHEILKNTCICCNKVITDEIYCTCCKPRTQQSVPLVSQVSQKIIKMLQKFTVKKKKLREVDVKDTQSTTVEKKEIMKLDLDQLKDYVSEGFYTSAMSGEIYAQSKGTSITIPYMLYNLSTVGCVYNSLNTIEVSENETDCAFSAVSFYTKEVYDAVDFRKKIGLKNSDMLTIDEVLTLYSSLNINAIIIQTNETARVLRTRDDNEYYLFYAAESHICPAVAVGLTIYTQKIIPEFFNLEIYKAFIGSCNINIFGCNSQEYLKALLNFMTKGSKLKHFGPYVSDDKLCLDLNNETIFIPLSAHISKLTDIIHPNPKTLIEPPFTEHNIMTNTLATLKNDVVCQIYNIIYEMIYVQLPPGQGEDKRVKRVSNCTLKKEGNKMVVQPKIHVGYEYLLKTGDLVYLHDAKDSMITAFIMVKGSKIYVDASVVKEFIPVKISILKTSFASMFVDLKCLIDCMGHEDVVIDILKNKTEFVKGLPGSGKSTSISLKKLTSNSIASAMGSGAKQRLVELMEGRCKAKIYSIEKLKKMNANQLINVDYLIIDEICQMMIVDCSFLYKFKGLKKLYTYGDPEQIVGDIFYNRNIQVTIRHAMSELPVANSLMTVRRFGGELFRAYNQLVPEAMCGCTYDSEFEYVSIPRKDAIPYIKKIYTNHAMTLTFRSSDMNKILDAISDIHCNKVASVQGKEWDKIVVLQAEGKQGYGVSMKREFIITALSRARLKVTWINAYLRTKYDNWEQLVCETIIMPLELRVSMLKFKDVTLKDMFMSLTPTEIEKLVRYLAPKIGKMCSIKFSDENIELKSKTLSAGVLINPTKKTIEPIGLLGNALIAGIFNQSVAKALGTISTSPSDCIAQFKNTEELTSAIKKILSQFEKFSTISRNMITLSDNETVITVNPGLMYISVNSSYALATINEIIASNVQLVKVVHIGDSDQSMDEVINILLGGDEVEGVPGAILQPEDWESIKDTAMTNYYYSNIYNLKRKLDNTSNTLVQLCASDDNILSDIQQAMGQSLTIEMTSFSFNVIQVVDLVESICICMVKSDASILSALPVFYCGPSLISLFNNSKILTNVCQAYRDTITALYYSDRELAVQQVIKSVRSNLKNEMYNYKYYTSKQHNGYLILGINLMNQTVEQIRSILNDGNTILGVVLVSKQGNLDGYNLFSVESGVVYAMENHMPITSLKNTLQMLINCPDINVVVKMELSNAIIIELSLCTTMIKHQIKSTDEGSLVFNVWDLNVENLLKLQPSEVAVHLPVGFYRQIMYAILVYEFDTKMISQYIGSILDSATLTKHGLNYKPVHNIQYILLVLPYMQIGLWLILHTNVLFLFEQVLGESDFLLSIIPMLLPIINELPPIISTILNRVTTTDNVMANGILKSLYKIIVKSLSTVQTIDTSWCATTDQALHKLVGAEINENIVNRLNEEQGDMSLSDFSEQGDYNIVDTKFNKRVVTERNNYAIHQQNVANAMSENGTLKQNTQNDLKMYHEEDKHENKSWSIRGVYQDITMAGCVADWIKNIVRTNRLVKATEVMTWTKDSVILDNTVYKDNELVNDEQKTLSVQLIQYLNQFNERNKNILNKLYHPLTDELRTLRDQTKHQIDYEKYDDNSYDSLQRDDKNIIMDENDELLAEMAREEQKIILGEQPLKQGAHKSPKRKEPNEESNSDSEETMNLYTKVHEVISNLSNQAEFKDVKAKKKNKRKTIIKKIKDDTPAKPVEATNQRTTNAFASLDITTNKVPHVKTVVLAREYKQLYQTAHIEQMSKINTEISSYVGNLQDVTSFFIVTNHLERKSQIAAIIGKLSDTVTYCTTGWHHTTIVGLNNANIQKLTGGKPFHPMRNITPIADIRDIPFVPDKWFWKPVQPLTTIRHNCIPWKQKIFLELQETFKSEQGVAAVDKIAASCQMCGACIDASGDLITNLEQYLLFDIGGNNSSRQQHNFSGMLITDAILQWHYNGLQLRYGSVIQANKRRVMVLELDDNMFDIINRLIENNELSKLLNSTKLFIEFRYASDMLNKLTEKQLRYLNQMQAIYKNIVSDKVYVFVTRNVSALGRDLTLNPNFVCPNHTLTQIINWFSRDVNCHFYEKLTTNLSVRISTADTIESRLATFLSKLQDAKIIPSNHIILKVTETKTIAESKETKDCVKVALTKYNALSGTKYVKAPTKLDTLITYLIRNNIELILTSPDRVRILLTNESVAAQHNAAIEIEHNNINYHAKLVDAHTMPMQLVESNTMNVDIRSDVFDLSIPEITQLEGFVNLEVNQHLLHLLTEQDITGTAIKLTNGASCITIVVNDHNTLKLAYIKRVMKLRYCLLWDNSNVSLAVVIYNKITHQNQILLPRGVSIYTPCMAFVLHFGVESTMNIKLIPEKCALYAYDTRNLKIAKTVLNHKEITLMPQGEIDNNSYILIHEFDNRKHDKYDLTAWNAKLMTTDGLIPNDWMKKLKDTHDKENLKYVIVDGRLGVYKKVKYDAFGMFLVSNFIDAYGNKCMSNVDDSITILDATLEDVNELEKLVKERASITQKIQPGVQIKLQEQYNPQDDASKTLNYLLEKKHLSEQIFGMKVIRLSVYNERVKVYLYGLNENLLATSVTNVFCNLGSNNLFLLSGLFGARPHKGDTLQWLIFQTKLLFINKLRNNIINPVYSQILKGSKTFWYYTRTIFNIAFHEMKLILTINPLLIGGIYNITLGGDNFYRLVSTIFTMVEFSGNITVMACRFINIFSAQLRNGNNYPLEVLLKMITTIANMCIGSSEKIELLLFTIKITTLATTPKIHIVHGITRIIYALVRLLHTMFSAQFDNGRINTSPKKFIADILESIVNAIVGLGYVIYDRSFITALVLNVVGALLNSAGISIGLIDQVVQYYDRHSLFDDHEHFRWDNREAVLEAEQIQYIYEEMSMHSNEIQLRERQFEQAPYILIMPQVVYTEQHLRLLDGNWPNVIKRLLNINRKEHIYAWFEITNQMHDDFDSIIGRYEILVTKRHGAVREIWVNDVISKIKYNLQIALKQHSEALTFRLNNRANTARYYIFLEDVNVINFIDKHNEAIEWLKKMIVQTYGLEEEHNIHLVIYKIHNKMDNYELYNECVSLTNIENLKFNCSKNILYDIYNKQSYMVEIVLDWVPIGQTLTKLSIKLKDKMLDAFNVLYRTYIKNNGPSQLAELLLKTKLELINIQQLLGVRNIEEANTCKLHFTSRIWTAQAVDIYPITLSAVKASKDQFGAWTFGEERDILIRNDLKSAFKVDIKMLNRVQLERYKFLHKLVYGKWNLNIFVNVMLRTEVLRTIVEREGIIGALNYVVDWISMGTNVQDLVGEVCHGVKEGSVMGLRYVKNIIANITTGANDLIGAREQLEYVLKTTLELHHLTDILEVDYMQRIPNRQEHFSEDVLHAEFVELQLTTKPIDDGTWDALDHWYLTQSKNVIINRNINSAYLVLPRKLSTSKLSIYKKIHKLMYANGDYRLVIFMLMKYAELKSKLGTNNIAMYLNGLGETTILKSVKLIQVISEVKQSLVSYWQSLIYIVRFGRSRIDEEQILESMSNEPVKITAMTLLLQSIADIYNRVIHSIHCLYRAHMPNKAIEEGDQEVLHLLTQHIVGPPSNSIVKRALCNCKEHSQLGLISVSGTLHAILGIDEEILDHIHEQGNLKDITSVTQLVHIYETSSCVVQEKLTNDLYSCQCASIFKLSPLNVYLKVEQRSTFRKVIDEIDNTLNRHLEACEMGLRNIPNTEYIMGAINDIITRHMNELLMKLNNKASTIKQCSVASIYALMQKIMKLHGCLKRALWSKKYKHDLDNTGIDYKAFTLNAPLRVSVCINGAICSKSHGPLPQGLVFEGKCIDILHVDEQNLNELHKRGNLLEIEHENDIIKIEQVSDCQKSDMINADWFMAQCTNILINKHINISFQVHRIDSIMLYKNIIRLRVNETITKMVLTFKKFRNVVSLITTRAKNVLGVIKTSLKSITAERLGMMLLGNKLLNLSAGIIGLSQLCTDRSIQKLTAVTINYIISKIRMDNDGALHCKTTLKRRLQQIDADQLTRMSTIIITLIGLWNPLVGKLMSYALNCVSAFRWRNKIIRSGNEFIQHHKNARFYWITVILLKDIINARMGKTSWWMNLFAHGSILYVGFHEKFVNWCTEECAPHALLPDMNEIDVSEDSDIEEIPLNLLGPIDLNTDRSGQLNVQQLTEPTRGMLKMENEAYMVEPLNNIPTNTNSAWTINNVYRSTVEMINSAKNLFKSTRDKVYNLPSVFVEEQNTCQIDTMMLYELEKIETAKRHLSSDVMSSRKVRLTTVEQHGVITSKLSDEFYGTNMINIVYYKPGNKYMQVQAVYGSVFTYKWLSKEIEKVTKKKAGKPFVVNNYLQCLEGFSMDSGCTPKIASPHGLGSCGCEYCKPRSKLSKILVHSDPRELSLTEQDYVTEVTDYHYFNNIMHDLDEKMIIHSNMINHLKLFSDKLSIKQIKKRYLTNEIPDIAKPAIPQRFNANLNATSRRVVNVIKFQTKPMDAKFEAMQTAKTFFVHNFTELSRDFRSKPVGFSFEGTIKWLQEHPNPDVKQSELVNWLQKLQNVKSYTDIKTFAKYECFPKFEQIDLKEDISERVIMGHSYYVAALFCPVFEEIKARLKMSLSSKFYYLDGLTEQQVEDLYNSISYTGDEWLFEDDASKQDRQTTHELIDAEFYIYNMLGLSDLCNEMWRQVHNNWRAYCNKFRLKWDAMRITGSATTALGNVIVNMIIHRELIQKHYNSLKICTFLGDDHHAIYTVKVDAAFHNRRSREYYNMETKSKCEKVVSTMLQHLVFIDDKKKAHFEPNVIRLSARIELMNTGHIEDEIVYLRKLSYAMMIGGVKQFSFVKKQHRELIPECKVTLLGLNAAAKLYNVPLGVAENCYRKLIHVLNNNEGGVLEYKVIV